MHRGRGQEPPPRHVEAASSRRDRQLRHHPSRDALPQPRADGAPEARLLGGKRRRRKGAVRFIISPRRKLGLGSI